MPEAVNERPPVGPAFLGNRPPGGERMPVLLETVQVAGRCVEQSAILLSGSFEMPYNLPAFTLDVLMSEKPPARWFAHPAAARGEFLRVAARRAVNVSIHKRSGSNGGPLAASATDLLAADRELVHRVARAAEGPLESLRRIVGQLMMRMEVEFNPAIWACSPLNPEMMQDLDWARGIVLRHVVGLDLLGHDVHHPCEVRRDVVVRADF